MTKPLSAEQKQGSLISFIVENSQVVLVLREPLEIIYRNLASKLGNPKEFKPSPEFMKAPVESEQDPSVQFKIPNSVIKGNLNLQDNEFTWAMGGTIPISKLTP